MRSHLSQRRVLAQPVVRAPGCAAHRADQFPPPIAKVSGGTLYMRSMIDAFKAHRTRTAGRPVSLQAQVSEELTRIPKDRQNPVQQSLRMIYNMGRLHDLKVDQSASRHQSLFLAIKQTPRQEGFEPRYNTEFFQPEPPDQRYRVLHAECDPGHDQSIWEEAR
jgi:hypothetical protein